MPQLYSRFSDLLLLSAPHDGAEAHFRLSLLALFSLAFSKIHPFDVNEPKQVPCFTQGHRPFTPPSFLTVLHIRKTNNLATPDFFAAPRAPSISFHDVFSGGASETQRALHGPAFVRGEIILGAQFSEHQQCMRELRAA